MKTVIILKGLIKKDKTKWVYKEGLENYLLDYDMISKLYSNPELIDTNTEQLSKSYCTEVYQRFIELLIIKLSRGKLVVIDSGSESIKGIESLATIFGYKIFYKIFSIPQDYLFNNKKYILNYDKPKKKKELEVEIKNFLDLKLPMNSTINSYSDVLDFWKKNELILELEKSDKVLHISDIHSNFSLLSELNLNNYDFCIFHGDYIDGKEPGGSRKLINKITSNKIMFQNYIFLEGNHELNLRKYLGWIYLKSLNNKSIISSSLYSSIPETFLNTTAKEFSDLNTSESLSMLNRINEKLLTYLYIKRGNKTYICSHAGLKYIEQITPKQIGTLIYGSRNVDEQDCEFSKRYRKSNIFSIHGHCYYQSINPFKYRNVINIDQPEENTNELLFLENYKNNKFKIGKLCQEK